MATIPENQLPGGGFDAARWLSDWAENGGIVFLAHDHVYLRRFPVLDPGCAEKLDRLATLMLRVGGGPAIAETLARRREGDLP